MRNARAALTKREARLLEMLAAGRAVGEAWEVAGYAAEGFAKRALSRPRMKAKWEALKALHGLSAKDIRDRAERRLVEGADAQIDRLEGISKTAEDEAVQLRATMNWLDRAKIGVVEKADGGRMAPVIALPAEAVAVLIQALREGPPMKSVAALDGQCHRTAVELEGPTP